MTEHYSGIMTDHASKYAKLDKIIAAKDFRMNRYMVSPVDHDYLDKHIPSDRTQII